MSISTSLGALLILGLLGLILGTGKRILLWRKGNGSCDRADIAAVFTIPKRYFVDLHHRVSRKKQSAYMHMFFAGAALLILLFGVAAWIWPVTLIVKAVFSLILTVFALGVVLLFIRRIGTPQYLSYGKYLFTVPAAIALLCGLLLVLWTQYRLAGTLLASAGLINIFWSGWFDLPLKHMISGAAHLAFHPRPQRFQGDNASGLRTIDTQQETGVRNIEDFSWRQILGFDACIECGRCQQVCPAFASGQPLNPKKLIQDVYFLSKNTDDRAYTGSGHPHKESKAKDCKHNTINGDIEQLIDPDTLYACTTCRACVEECPMMIEHVDAVVDMRRHLAMNTGNLPDKAAETLTNLRQTDTAGGHNNSQRHSWMADMELPWANTEQRYDVLLLCGESVFDLRARSNLRQLIGLLKRAGKTVALLRNEADCGDLARRLGDEIQFQRLARQMITQLNGVQFKKIITLDPHIYHCIGNEYSELGGHYNISHASSYLYELIVEQKALPVAPLETSITYHDPCYLGRYNGVIDAPRALLQHIGIELQEMERSKKQSRCCGWGGGAAFSDIPGDNRIPDMRMDDIRETGAATVAVSCPNCMTMLEGVVAPRAEVVDLVTLVTRSVQQAEAEKSA